MLKKLICITVLGLSITSVASFGYVLPCKQNYGPASAKAGFCSCYAQSARDNCHHLKQGSMCDEDPGYLLNSAEMEIIREGGVTVFCKNQAKSLQSYGVTESGCIEDINEVTVSMTKRGKHNSACNGIWNT